MIGKEPLVIYALVFTAALLGIQGLYWLLFKERYEKKAINRRLSLHTQITDASEVLETLRRERSVKFLANVPQLLKVHELIVQSGLKLNGPRIAAPLLGLAVLFFVLLKFSTGSNVAAISLAAPLAFALGYFYVRRTRSRRIAVFSEQLPDALDVIVRGLRAGHPFRVALALVAREMKDPVGSEFGIAADEIMFGLEQPAAIDNLCKRVGQEDLTFFATAISIQQQSGGNLAEILGRLSRLLRSRVKLKLKIRALSAEGRLSAVVLSATPFVLIGLIRLIAPNYFAATNDSPLTMPSIIVGAALLIIGNVTMYRMVNFKY